MTQKQIIESVVAFHNLSIRKLGLRFDRTALSLLSDLSVISESHIPKGMVLLIAVTAPIRLPSQTSTAIGKKITSQFANKNTLKTLTFVTHSNHIQIRLVKQGKFRKFSTVGFVHNPNVNPNKIFDFIEDWISSKK